MTVWTALHVDCEPVRVAITEYATMVDIAVRKTFRWAETHSAPRALAVASGPPGHAQAGKP